MPSPRLRRTLFALCLPPLLAACENSATAYVIDTAQHALILVRERPYIWNDTVNQAIIASRLPHCQRRVDIHPGQLELTEMEVFEAGDHLWALHQGERWYLASTDQCLVQDWAAPVEAPGPLVGAFRLKDGAPTFVPAGE